MVKESNCLFFICSESMKSSKNCDLVVETTTLKPAQKMSFTARRFTSSLVAAAKNGSRNEFENELQKNPVLWQLWNLPHLKPLTDAHSNINATSTLPIIYRSRPAVFHDVSKEYPEAKGVGLQLKQYTAYAKSVIHFYRIGIKNVWNNRRAVSALKKNYHIETADKLGKVVQRRFKNGKDLVKVLGSLESLTRIEQDAIKKLDRDLVLNITRKEFLTVLRTEQDFYKIPLFALILLVFAEMTPVLCFVFPEITPSTCVFPSLLTKLNKSSIVSLEKLNSLRLQRYNEEYYSKGIYPAQNAWKLPKDELDLLIDVLNLKSRYLPVGVYPDSILRQRLSDRFNQLKVDNYFLISGSTQPHSNEVPHSSESSVPNSENFWSLSKSELIRSCIDRGLIDFDKDDLVHIGSHELKIRLFFHLGLFENDKSIGNVGLFGLDHLNSSHSIHFNRIEKDTAHQIHQWWINKQ